MKKVGDGEALHTIFQARQPVGVLNDNTLDADEDAAEDLILSRILWLHGLAKTMQHQAPVHLHSRRQSWILVRDGRQLWMHSHESSRGGGFI